MIYAALEKGFAPFIAFVLLILGWQGIVAYLNIPAYVLPSPLVIFLTLIKDWPTLSTSLWVTLCITFEALLAAVIGGVLLAILFAQFKWVERAFLPFAVILQVTPIVAIAPLLLIYLPAQTAVLVCAFLVAFFPILANMSLGLAATDRHLAELFKLYRGSKWQSLLYLRLPSALPYFLGGLRIGGGLALIGAIVAELAAGAAGSGSGLAFRIVEAGYRLDIPRMFAGLTLISLTGIAIFACFTMLSNVLLRRWHDSALEHGN
jgi:NitT/TauT family transport system permease protein